VDYPTATVGSTRRCFRYAPYVHKVTDSYLVIPLCIFERRIIMQRLRLALVVVALVGVVFLAPLDAVANRTGSASISGASGGLESSRGETTNGEWYCTISCSNGSGAGGEVDDPMDCLYACEAYCGEPCTLIIEM
jgi:hypothetical protein